MLGFFIIRLYILYSLDGRIISQMPSGGLSCCNFLGISVFLFKFTSFIYLTFVYAYKTRGEDRKQTKVLKCVKRNIVSLL